MKLARNTVHKLDGCLPLETLDSGSVAGTALLWPEAYRLPPLPGEALAHAKSVAKRTPFPESDLCAPKAVWQESLALPGETFAHAKSVLKWTPFSESDLCAPKADWQNKLPLPGENSEHAKSVPKRTPFPGSDLCAPKADWQNRLPLPGENSEHAKSVAKRTPFPGSDLCVTKAVWQNRLPLPGERVGVRGDLRIRFTQYVVQMLNSCQTTEIGGSTKSLCLKQWALRQ